MTPLLAALSSFWEAVRSAVSAASRSPVSAASRKCRIAVLSEDLTLLLRRRATSLVRIRLSWDLMFATNASGLGYGSQHVRESVRTGLGTTTRAYQRRGDRPKSPTAGS